VYSKAQHSTTTTTNTTAAMVSMPPRVVVSRALGLTPEEVSGLDELEKAYDDLSG
jgi:hypothetical protein